MQFSLANGSFASLYYTKTVRQLLMKTKQTNIKNAEKTLKAWTTLRVIWTHEIFLYVYVVEAGSSRLNLVCKCRPLIVLNFLRLQNFTNLFFDSTLLSHLRSILSFFQFPHGGFKLQLARLVLIGRILY